MCRYFEDKRDEGLFKTIVLGVNGVLLVIVPLDLFLDVLSKNGREQVNSVLRLLDLVDAGRTTVPDDCDTKMHIVGDSVRVVEVDLLKFN